MISKPVNINLKLDKISKRHVSKALSTTSEKRCRRPREESTQSSTGNPGAMAKEDDEQGQQTTFSARAMRQAKRALQRTDWGDAHPQQQSLFCTKLPTEVRLMIFALVFSDFCTATTTRTHDTSCLKHGKNGSHITRYDFQCTNFCDVKLRIPKRCMLQRRAATAILRTCRFIYQEAHQLPVRSLEVFVSHLRRLVLQ